MLEHTDKELISSKFTTGVNGKKAKHRPFDSKKKGA